MYKGQEIISRMMKVTGVHTQEGLAALLDVEASTLSHYKKRDRVPRKWLTCLERFQGVNPDYLLSGEGDMRSSCGVGAVDDAVAKIPIIAQHLSPKGAYVPLGDSENCIRFETGWLAKRCSNVNKLLLLRFNSPNMSPEIREGDLVLFDQDNTKISSHALFVVRIEEAISVHRVILGAGVIHLRNDHREYPDQEIKRELLGSPQFEVLGKVLGIFRKYS